MEKSFFLTGLLLVAAPLNAAPDKPENAADPDKGTSCWVRGSESQAYVTDPTCDFHLVAKADKDGNRTFLRYQDKGNLQSGQAAPDKALKIDISATIGGQSCSGTEVISPSGNYSSDLTCR